ncbi:MULTISPECIES: acyltransferase family protein [Marinobacter]|uniref:acyltransferase family protein n=1 Tax=Marinobacter TaxID=2742 RepID=UPI000DAEC7A1|nr:MULTISPECIES: acyltransferase [Marinobacter]
MAGASQRLQALDALRGIAAVGVMLFHYIPYYDELYGHDFEPWSPLAFGRYGVHLFYILSGFVIFMTLERTSTARWFGLARAFRLLPALWVGILLTSLSVHFLGPADRATTLTETLWNFSLLHEYLGMGPVDGAYWSLVVEATFYVWMALLFYGLGAQRLRPVFWAWVIGSYVAVRYWKSIPDGLDFLVKDLLFMKYAPLFISGMLLYRWHRHGTPPLWDRVLLVLSIGHCLLAYKAPFNVFVLGCYGVFILAITGYLNLLANRFLLTLGSLSYSLYLVHQNIGYGIIGLSYDAGLPGGVGVALAVATALCLAWLIHKGVEQPALRWFRERRKQTAESTPSGGEALDVGR